uniref:Pentacotripeptide-repeat region of PRORP domain-containing protein n=1 Tax=Trypanosoma vivax (strain Y486) TaxID=1055687 RepID=G0UC07_TRYVY|nr:hypothetical protein TVY486_1108390 [Trypanosoma vivax Y486]
MHKKVGYAELLNSKLRCDKLLAHRDAVRRSKLKAFIEQHRHASQWATCIAALVDAAHHNVVPTSDMLSDAIERCGKRGMLGMARRIYTDFHRGINKPRSLKVHVAYMAACADCRDFNGAHEQFLKLRGRDAVQIKARASYKPVVNDELTAEYLRAALTASDRLLHVEAANMRHTSPRNEACEDDTKSEVSGADSPLPWEVALEQFVSLRTSNEGFRAHNALTPVVVERVARLLQVGGNWLSCLRLIKQCAQRNVLIPPEARDVAISLCYQHGRHVEVVQQVQEMVATRSPPDERSVRLALTSCEEVTSLQKNAPSPSPLHEHPGWSVGLSLFNAMRSNGIPMYQQNYESPLRSCAMAGKWEEAVLILGSMKKDKRPISPQIYRLVIASRIERCASFEEAHRFAQAAVMQDGGIIVYLSLLRCCMNVRDWKNFDRVNKEMRDRECPETFEKMHLLIRAAHMREQWHSVLMRFARLESITSYELKRVRDDRVVREYKEDFEVPDALLDMVLDAYKHLKNHKDPVVHVAYRAALRRKSRGTEQLVFSSHNPNATPVQEWMFSHGQGAKDVSTRFY